MNDGHKWTFAAPGVPWARYDDRGRRLPDDWPQRLTKQYLLIRLVGYIVLALMLALGPK